MKGKETKAPKLRFPGFEGEWKVKKLGKLAEFSKGKGYSKADLKKDGAPVILYGRLYTAYKAKIEEVDTFAEPCKGAVYSKGGEVIVPSSGETAEDIARASAILPPGVLLGGDLNIISPKEELDSVFLALVLSNGRCKKSLAKKAQGKSIVHLHNSDLVEIEIAYPCKEEQEKIVAGIDRIESVIVEQEGKIAHLQNVKKSLLQKMFPKDGGKVPELRFPEFSGDWEWRRLGEVGDAYSGLFGKTKEDFGHGQGQYITYKNVFLNAITKREMLENIEIDSKQNEVMAGDVFFTISSETPEEVGMSSVLTESNTNTYLNSFCFGYRPRIYFDKYFLAYVLRSDGFRKKMFFLAQGISRYNISKNKVMNAEMPIPAKDEQQKIGKAFYNLDILITLHQRKLEHLRQLKRGLLQQMLV